MIVYADRKRRVSTKIPDGNWRDKLIRLGEVESAIADMLCPESDSPHPVLDQLRAISIRVASGDVSAVERMPVLPESVYVSIPEGYAYYAVYPEDYADAARRFLREVRPRKIVVIGIRSIGASLSAVVAAVLQQAGYNVCSFTVRPRGHPFDRRAEWAGFDCDPEAHFLIVDEGPGLSGSSFAGVARRLSQLGVPDSQIVFFPSWDADGSSFCSETARQQWRRHRRYVEYRERFADCRDISAGKWRDLLGVMAPAQPQHERRKYLRDETLFKFEGLGDLGKTRFERASILWEAGFTTRPLTLDDGYLGSEFSPGIPIERADRNMAEWTRRYLEFIEAHFPSERAVPFEENMAMIRVNVEEGLGIEWANRLDALDRFRAAVCDAQTYCIDGRILPYEFLHTRGGILKVDALDHHDDHFFPGCQDVVWDIAAMTVEFGSDDFVSPGITARLPFYVIAYLSYRLGYCTMAANSSSDVIPFRRLADSYIMRLRNEIDRVC